MQQFRYSALVAIVAMTMAAGSSQAAVIYDNGAPYDDSQRCAEDSGACEGTWTVFDDFVLSEIFTITDINWTSTLYDGLGDYNGIRAWIYDADPVFAGGTLLYTIGDQGGSPTANGNFFDVSLTGLNLVLGPGSYWLGMQHDTTSGYATVACNSVGCENSGNSTQWENSGVGYRSVVGQEYAFSIEGEAVTEAPAPATLALFGLGLAGLGWSRRI